MDYGQKFAPDGVYGLGSDGFANPIHLSPGTVTSTDIGHLAGTTANIQTQINALASGTSFRGGYDASSNVFPSTGGSGGGGAIEAGNNWIITIEGTLGGTFAAVGVTITALVNTPGQTAGNWNVPQNLVTSVFGRMGSITAQTGDYTVSQITGAAPLASPALTGTPTAPTQSPGDNSTKLATTAYVDAGVAAGVVSFNTRTGAVTAQTGDYTIAQITNGLSNVLTNGNIFVGNVSNLAIGVTPSGELSMTNAGVFTLLNSAVIGKVLTGLTPASGSIVATDTLLQAFNKTAYYLSNSVSSFNTRTGAVVPTTGDYTVSQVTGAAPLASPTFTGTPIAPLFNLTNNTNFLVAGTTNTMTFTMASLTSTRIFTLPDANSNSIVPSSAATNQFATGINSSGVISYAQPAFSNLSGTATIAQGGTGQTSANAALNALLPTQVGQSGKVFTTDGTNTSWAALSSLGVTSFNTRTGAVVPTTGDYTVGQITGAAPLASPALTGSPTAPTKTQGDNTTNIATTAYVDTGLALKSNIASPTFTGVPAAPTASPGTSTTQLATTAFVTTADNLKANLASPTFTGVPAAPTASPGTNTTQLATTAFVTASAAAGTLQTAYNNSSSPAIILLSGSKNFKVQNGVGDLFDVDPISNIVTAKNLALGVNVQGGVLCTSSSGELVPSDSINNISLKSAFVTTTQTTIFAPPTLPSGKGAWSVNVSNLNSMFNFSGTMTADITTSGLNGLDTGAVAANNWYALMPIFNTTSQLAGSLYTLTPASPSYPAGYAHGRNVLWQRFTASGFLKFTQIGNGATKRIFYTDSLASTSVLTNGSSTSFASVSLSSFLPAGVQSGIMSYTYATSVGAGFIIREAGSTVATPNINIEPGIASTTKGTFPFVCNSSQAIEYRNVSVADTLSLSVLSYDYDV